MAQVLLYLLAAFLGGVLVLVALMISFALSNRCSNGLVSVHFGGGGPITFYKDMRLLESEVREGKLYVRYENTGNKKTTTACFKVKVYDCNSRLIGESEEAAYDSTPPGTSNENLIESESLTELLLNDENKVVVALTYGYIE